MHAPRATYRVQLRPDFGFAEAAALAPYLRDLGVSHFYSSPYLQAAPGSVHGYDVVDPRRVNEELGGEAGHARFCATLRENDLGQILDIVPNHMAIGGPENPWWLDVLENGRASRYAPYFDVDWDPPEAKFRNRVLIPILGDHYGRVLEAGELRLERDGGTFRVRYHEHVVPVAPRSLHELLAEAAERAASDELGEIADAFRGLPPSATIDRAGAERRHRGKEVLKRWLARLTSEQPSVGDAVDAVIADVNADVERLDRLIHLQHYRLAYWRTAGRDLGYRRFFDVTTLIGLRMEEEPVFRDTHQRVLGWLREGVIDGLRVDHPDGLRDPEEYFTRLRAEAPRAWVVAEKILESGERLPRSWPVAGTTGYDFLNRVNGLFVDRDGEDALTELYQRFAGDTGVYAEVVRAQKHLVMRESLGSEVNRLTALFLDVCEQHRRHRDHTRHELHETLREVVAAFPVYRTYVRAQAGVVRDTDVACVEQAIADALAARPDLDPELFAFLRDVLLLRVTGTAESELVMRFQQLTGAVMAKGVEDTTFYTYTRLVSLNEVGGDPSRFGIPVSEFHDACRETQTTWPTAMLSTSTHDTKRSEDVRARLNLLSEIPDRWRDAVERWSAWNESYRSDGMPDRNAEYLLYQTLVGAWPIERERVLAYMQKATREAKTHTSWTAPSEKYEAALGRFIEGALGDAGFCADMERFVAGLVLPGRINALSQTLVKLTAPGVPDVYQGTELWDLSLVDPDNRRPVDFVLRRSLLDGVARCSPEEIMQGMDVGLPKLWLVRQALHLRRRNPAPFGPSSSHDPLAVVGERADHVVAFGRGGRVAVIVPRLPLRRGDGWGDTTVEIPGLRWRNELTGEELYGGPVPVGELLSRFPVALLSSIDDEA